MITQLQVFRDSQATLAGYLLYATVVAKGIFALPLVFTTAHLAVLEELARGSLAMFLGPWIGMGAALHEAVSWDFPLIDTLQHLILFAPSHIALSLLWSRHFPVSRSQLHPDLSWNQQYQPPGCPTYLPH